MNTEPGTIDAPRRCRTCGTVLDRHRLDSLCPACVLRAVLEPDGEELETVSPLRPLSPLSIPGHEVMEEIARGGMGIVYRARQLDPDRTVALKMLLPHQRTSAAMCERFRLETRVIAALEHAAILPVYIVGEHHGTPFFTMKFASGGTLAARRGNYHGRFRSLAELMIQIAGAVQFAHERGVLHRDLKPGNILFDETGQPYVSDFGLAKFVDLEEELTGSIHLLGTPHYLAPEVAVGGVRAATIASDVYSLGAVFYQLLTGRPPFEARGVPALIRKVTEEDPVPPSATSTRTMEARSESRLDSGGQGGVTEGVSRDTLRDLSASPSPKIPRDLDAICLKCLSKEPARRYGSARELAEDLQRWLDGNTTLARPRSRSERVWRRIQRNPVVALLAAVLLLVLMSGGQALLRTNLKLQRSLGDTRAALEETLLMQARLERSSGRIGQRFGTLELVDRATTLQPEKHVPLNLRRSALRSEVAGALALPDLRPAACWTIPVNGQSGAVAFTADLKRYVVASPEGGFKVVETGGQRVQRHFTGLRDNPAVQFQFSEDGQWLAAVFQDGHAEVHTVESEQPPNVFPGQSSDAPTEVEFLPRTFEALVASPGQGVVLHNLVNGTSREVVAAPATVLGLTADPDGRRFACLATGAVQVVSVADGVCLWTQPFPNGTARFAWSPNGLQLAVAESLRPYEITVFELYSGRIVAHFQDHELSVSRLVFHPDGHSLASVGLDNRLSWRQVSHSGWRLSGQAGPGALRFSADGRQLAYEPAWGRAGLLDVMPSDVFRQWYRMSPSYGDACMIAVSPDGRMVATSSSGAVHLWDAATGEEVDHLPLGRRLERVTVHFHPDGQSLLYSGLGLGVQQMELKRTESATPDQRSVEFGARRQISPGSEYLLEGIAPDQRSLIVRVGPKLSPATVWLWPNGDADHARPLTDGSPITSYHLTANGLWGLSAHWTEPDVWVWDPQTARRVRRLGLSVGADATAAPDDRWVLVTTSEHYQLWEVGSWKPGATWPHALQRYDRAGAFSADGRWLATAGDEGRVEIRSLPEADVVLNLPPPHPLRLHDLVFSPDRQRLYLLQGNGRLFEWDLEQVRRELSRRGLDWAD